MNGDIAVRSISASISLCTARNAPRTICKVTGSIAEVFLFVAVSCKVGPEFVRSDDDEMARSASAKPHEGGRIFDVARYSAPPSPGGGGSTAVAQRRRSGWGEATCTEFAVPLSPPPPPPPVPQNSRRPPPPGWA